MRKTSKSSHPTLTRPRFQLANRAARSVLLELGNPEPAVNLAPYFEKRGWKVYYEDLLGPDGYMMKISQGHSRTFVIYVASDHDPTLPFREETMKKKQNYTLAHELGHILLHSDFKLNTQDDHYAIPDEFLGIMEVEANWFAAQLLMPTYTFQTALDLTPAYLADKCQVNIQAAQKRLNKLSPDLRSSLLSSARLDKWPTHYHEDEVAYKEKWGSLEEAWRSSKLRLVCKDCGFFHNERFIFSLSCCNECGGKLLDMTGTI